MYMINLLAASPQGIAALATQGGTAALTERSDATFEVCQFLFADGAGLKPIKAGSLFDQLLRTAMSGEKLPMNLQEGKGQNTIDFSIQLDRKNTVIHVTTPPIPLMAGR